MSPFASLFVLGVVVFLAGWWCVTAIYNHAPEQEPQESEWDARDRGPRCTVEDCRVKVSVHVHAGHDYWPFCAEHGTPYLTEEMPCLVTCPWHPGGGNHPEAGAA